MCISPAIVESSMKVPQKTKNRTPSIPEILLLGMYPKKVKS
jgi:hypothetical protein